MDYDTVPRPLRHLDAVKLFMGTYTEAGDFSKCRLISCSFSIMYRPTCINSWQFLVKHLIQTTFQTNDSFRCFKMSMDRNMRTWFQSIQHPL